MILLTLQVIYQDLSVGDLLSVFKRLTESLHDPGLQAKRKYLVKERDFLQAFIEQKFSDLEDEKKMKSDQLQETTTLLSTTLSAIRHVKTTLLKTCGSLHREVVTSDEAVKAIKNQITKN